MGPDNLCAEGMFSHTQSAPSSDRQAARWRVLHKNTRAPAATGAARVECGLLLFAVLTAAPTVTHQRQRQQKQGGGYMDIIDRRDSEQVFADELFHDRH